MSLREVNKIFEKKNKSKQRDAKKVFYLACEGEKTEIHYFKMIESNKKKLNISENITIEPYTQSHNNPVALMEYLKIKKESEDLDDDEFFLVVDRDPKNFTKEQFEIVLEGCKNEKIGLALSNPCFELWLSLHFMPWNTNQNYSLLNGDYGKILKGNLIDGLKNLNPEIKTYSKDGINSLFPYFQGNIRNAISNSGLLEVDNLKLENRVGTSVGLLLGEILKNNTN